MSQRQSQRPRVKRSSSSNGTIKDIFNTMDLSMMDQDFKDIHDGQMEGLKAKAISAAELAKATVRYNKHHHKIRDELMKKGKDNAAGFVEEFNSYQNKSDEMLLDGGSAYNDLISLDSKCQRELGQVYVCASAKKLKSSEDFNWVAFKEAVRKCMKADSRKAGMPSVPLFINAFPTALATARRDKRPIYDFSSIDLKAVAEFESDTPKTAKTRRNYKQELKQNTQVSQPSLATDNKEDDSELLFKLEQRIIAVEKKYGRQAMPMAQLACDPTSFQNTVENFAKLSFLLQQGTLQYFVEDGERMVITTYNATKTGFKVPELTGQETHYMHYDIATWQHWVEKYDVREHLLKDI